MVSEFICESQRHMPLQEMMNALSLGKFNRMPQAQHWNDIQKPFVFNRSGTKILSCQLHQSLIVSLKSDFRNNERKRSGNVTLECNLYDYIKKIRFFFFSFPNLFCSLLYLQGVEKCLVHIHSVNICERKEGRKEEKEWEGRNTNVSKFLYADHPPHLPLPWLTWLPIFKRPFFF